MDENGSICTSKHIQTTKNKRIQNKIPISAGSFDCLCAELKASKAPWKPAILLERSWKDSLWDIEGLVKIQKLRKDCLKEKRLSVRQEKEQGLKAEPRLLD